MRFIEAILLVVVLGLLGNTLYKRFNKTKADNLALSKLTSAIAAMQEQINSQQETLNSLKNKLGDKTNVSKEIQDSSNNLNSQLELLSEDISAKLEKSEEVLNFLMEKEKKRIASPCCGQQTKKQTSKIIKKTVVSEKCEDGKKFLLCLNNRQRQNLKSCQEAKLVQQSAHSKTAETRSSKTISKLENIRQDLIVARVNAPITKLVVAENCFESEQDSYLGCQQLLCGK